MKHTPLQISMGLSLLVHGLVFGVVYAMKQPDLKMKEVPPSTGIEVLEIVSVPENNPVVQTHVTIPQIAESSSILTQAKPAVEIEAVVKTLIKTKQDVEMAETDLADDLAVMEELQPTNALSADENPAQPSDFFEPTASTKPVVHGVGCLSNPKPVYPREARRRHQEGVVMLALTVTQSGDASDVRVEHSSGFQLLDAAALEAVKRWKFSPASVDDKAVAARVEIPVRFTLAG